MAPVRGISLPLRRFRLSCIGREEQLQGPDRSRHGHPRGPAKALLWVRHIVLQLSSDRLRRTIIRVVLMWSKFLRALSTAPKTIPGTHPR